MANRNSSAFVQIKDLSITTVPSFFYLTSTLYPLEFIDNISTEFSSMDGRVGHKDNLGVQRYNQDNIKQSFTEVQGTLKVALKVYNHYLNTIVTDSVSYSYSGITGTLRTILRHYTIKYPDNTKISYSDMTGTLRSLLIIYTNYLSENLKIAFDEVELTVQSFSENVETYIPIEQAYASQQRTFTNVLMRTMGVVVEEEGVSTFRLASKSNKEPNVIVNEYTTSALNFENGLIDQVGTTVWNKEGTADIMNTNKIFGDNSFETKALGDSLYTNSNIITGGATPFTIEFFVLIKDLPTHEFNVNPLWTKSNNAANSDHGLFINKTNKNIVYYRGISIGSGLNSTIDVGSTKIQFNEINKITHSYDGSSHRIFINDILDKTYGSNIGIPIVNEPFRLFDKLVPNYRSMRANTKGIIDNINIHDGIATKVRDPDPYEEYLVVDLAFDGENNSTKIVDNGIDKNNWTVSGNAKLSTAQPFDGFSSLYLDGNHSRIQIQPNKNFIMSNNEDFTISFSFICLDINKINYIFSRRGNTNESSTTERGGYAIILSNSKIYFFGWYGTTNDITAVEVISNQLSQNVKYKVDIIRKNMNCYLYINGLLHASSKQEYEFTDANFITYIGQDKVESNSPSRDFNGYIKNFKIYKGVAVIPESPVGKIQLDFDNNVIDKYGNSTWTNNGVTFDQVNSVKGHAAYFNGNQSNKLLTTALIPFNINNFKFSIDVKFTNFNNNAVLFSSKSYLMLFYIVSSKCFQITTMVNGDYTVNTLFTRPANLLTNVYYKIEVILKGDKGILIINDEIHQVISNLREIPTDVATTYYIGSGVDSNTSITGYIDNFKSQVGIEDIKEVIDKPAVHLPLETNAINTGFTPLTINSFGNPTYTTIDGKKCIKFQSGKYLSINSDNIFNLGTSSDFYIEFDFYPESLNVENLLFSNSTYFSTKSVFLIIIAGVLNITYANVTYSISGTNVTYGQWYNLKLYREKNDIYIMLNNVEYLVPFPGTSNPLNFSNDELNFGICLWFRSADFNGYMSNFKMFVGTSEIPETYNDKKVLDLDFKPTGKSYIFKDNNNKCIIHPVNITQRDYQDSQYCCTFNGTNQYLQLGKNDLFNFGLDDFVINVKFKINSLKNPHGRLIDTGLLTAPAMTYIMITGQDHTNPRKLYLGINERRGINLYSVSTFNINEIYDVKVVRNGDSFKLYINDILDSSVNSTELFNLNIDNNTLIGTGYSKNYSQYFDGTIYSIKVLRNTTDVSLLEEVEEPSWEIKEEKTVGNNYIKYLGTKANKPKAYNSFAFVNLRKALMKSFKDADMQKLQSFTDAIYYNYPERISHKVDVYLQNISVSILPDEIDYEAVADTLFNRWQNAKNQELNILPDFVGKDVFQNIIEDIGWEMDEGGEITRSPTLEEVDINSLQKVWVTNTLTSTRASTPERSCELAYSTYARPGSNNVYKTFNEYDGKYYCPSTQAGVNSRGFGVIQRNNPNYDPNAPSVDRIVVNPDEIAQGVREALESNNPDFDTAIIAAYSFDSAIEQENTNQLFYKNKTTISFQQVALALMENKYDYDELIWEAAEDYINIVADSVYEEGKDWILEEDVKEQFELNIDIDVDNLENSPWILNEDFVIDVEKEHVFYTVYKEIENDFYDSVATVYLPMFIERSFIDPDMQQWQAVKDAVRKQNENYTNFVINVDNETFLIGNYPETVDNEAVAETLVNRWQNARNQELDVLPEFVGKDVFQEVINSIGWVMDEGGKVTGLPTDPTSTDPKPNEQYMWKFNGNGTFSDLELSYASSRQVVCDAVLASHTAKGAPWYYNQVEVVSSSSSTAVICHVSSNRTSFNGNATAFRVANPSYDSNASQPEPKEIDPLELQIALQQALLNNNAMQTAMIAAAYSFDNESYQSNTNSLFNENHDVVPLVGIAENLISNSQNGEEMEMLLAEAYMKAVAQDIYQGENSKGFTSLEEELEPLFEYYKTLRSFELKGSDWILNEEVLLKNLDVLYTAYQNYGEDIYDSYAYISLVDILTNSFYDENMLEWQGFIDAANELTGVTDWSVDIVNSNVHYTEISDPNLVLHQYLWKSTYLPQVYAYADSVDYAKEICILSTPEGRTFDYVMSYGSTAFYCSWNKGSDSFSKQPNSNYDPNGAVVIEKHINFSEIAQKIILNVQSSNESISIHAENYINQVANSIFENNLDKQFVTLLDIEGQLELNKVLRETNIPTKPIELFINPIAPIFNATLGSYLEVTGEVVSTTDPTMTVYVNNILIDNEHIVVEKVSGVFNFTVRLLTDDYFGNISIKITAENSTSVSSKTVNVTLDKKATITDYSRIDVSGVLWERYNKNNIIQTDTIANFGTGLYFNGSNSLVSYNKNWNIGLSQFKIEFDIYLLRHTNSSWDSTILSYGEGSSINNTWYYLSINRAGNIIFGSPGNLITVTEVTLNINRKYSIKVERDSLYNLRIYVDDVLVKTSLFNINLCTTSKNNVLNIGKRSDRVGNYNSDQNFNGYLKNIYVGVGDNTENGNVTKSLLNLSNKSDTNIEDEAAEGLVWVNTNTTTSEKGISFLNANSNLTSNSSDILLLNNVSNWTIDITCETTHSISRAVILDTRKLEEDFTGLLLEQTSADPTMFTLKIGLAANTGFNYTLTTGVNSIKINTTTHLRIVKSLSQIILYQDGVIKSTVDVGFNPIITTDNWVLGNNRNKTVPFRGSIKTFRVLNGVANTIRNYEITT